MPTDPRTIEAYNNNAQSYHEHVTDSNDSPYHAYYEKPAIRSLLPDLKGKKVLSIGCGSGVDTHWLYKQNALEVVGIDISKGLIELARKNYPDITFEVMDMESMSLKDNSFDIAYSSLAIHYLEDWTKSLKEAYRILKPGGVYVFSCGHPIDSALETIRTKDSKTRIIKIEKNTSTKKIMLNGDYMAHQTGGAKPIEGLLRTMEVYAYHQTFSRMINSIVSSGFNIEKLTEPLPSEQMKKVSPENYEKLMRIPSFMIWSLKKPV